MSIKVTFEIGHVASLKSKTTPEGFTHDWELFVRGSDGNNISRFVEKVVFNLHESFPKPKRTIKEPLYTVKESGYAGFIVPIDIHFKSREEPKKVSYQYDLVLQSNGTISNAEKKSFIFVNPTSDFRRKLIEGGGIPINPSGNPLNDDKSRDALDERTQLISKPKLSSSGTISGGSGGGIDNSNNKKHKNKSITDEVKPSSTFADLFGTPITKMSNLKQSPEQKLSNSSSNTKLSNQSNNANSGSSSSKQSSQKSEKFSSKDGKLDKSSKEKRDKNKLNSPLKEASGKESSSSKKNIAADDKHERREEKRKEKSHTKDRERTKDKLSKRPPSPKQAPIRSPKRSISPISRTITTNRHPSELQMKIDEKSSATSNGSSTKKSKKDKRDKSFDKERDRSTAADNKKDRENKQLQQQSQQHNKQKDEKPLSKSLEKINGTNKKDKDAGSGNSTPKDATREKSSSKFRSFDTKVESPIDLPPQNKNVLPVESSSSKKSEKYEKDGSDRKHKHKKKDKNKDKDKDRSGSKDRKKEKEKLSKAGVKEMSEESSASSNHKRSHAQTPPSNTLTSIHALSSKQTNSMNTANLLGKLSDDNKSSSDFEMEEDYVATSPMLPSAKIEKLDVVNSILSDQQTINLPDVVIAPPKLSTPKQLHSQSPNKLHEKNSKKSSKESKINNSVSSKEEKKRKRKNKNEKFDSGNSSKRKTQSPLINDEQPPPNKQLKRDEPVPTGKSVKENSIADGRPSQTPPTIGHVSDLSSSQSQHHQPQQSDSITSTSSTSLPNLSTDSSFRSPGEPIPVDYISQLRSLQHKIMSLQDNSELQQVVEMIAATGCYEITSRTFDFDLCALDRTTVQRLQDFFSQSQSVVL